MYLGCHLAVDNLLKYTGYGNAAGLLVARGLLAGGRGETQYSEDEDSDTEEYKSAKPLCVLCHVSMFTTRVCALVTYKLVCCFALNSFCCLFQHQPNHWSRGGADAESHWRDDRGTERVRSSETRQYVWQVVKVTILNKKGLYQKWVNMCKARRIPSDNWKRAEILSLFLQEKHIILNQYCHKNKTNQ